MEKKKREEAENFLVRVAKHRNTLHRGAVEFPPLEIFKTQLDNIMDNLLQLTLHSSPGVPANFNYAVILQHEKTERNAQISR